jgi:LPXTG-site transpeptidase (sortase) family protein
MIRVPRRALLERIPAASALWILSASAAFAQTDSAPRDDQQPGYGPAEWMRIPRIGVDAHVSEVGTTDGFYDVPWFDVGHHHDSHAPGEAGNSIFNGHVVTINAGDVFRRLHELGVGDAVYVYTPDFRVDWVVTDSLSVSGDDSSFLADSDSPRITLYTCTGQFDPIERSYADRLVVVGELVSVSLRVPSG